jgi:hypothetical protein
MPVCILPFTINFPGVSDINTYRLWEKAVWCLSVSLEGIMCHEGTESTAVELVHQSSDSNSSIFKTSDSDSDSSIFETPTPP